MDQVKSPSLISDEKYFEKIITSFENYKIDEYDDKNLRSKVGLIDANKSLMFCSRPKIYRSNSNSEGILTAFIDIFVKGAEIISIFPQTGQDPVNSGNFQLDGLYKITASVE
jgi:hypothetical protein